LLRRADEKENIDYNLNALSQILLCVKTDTTNLSIPALYRLEGILFTSFGKSNTGPKLKCIGEAKNPCSHRIVELQQEREDLIQQLTYGGGV
jgi:hypothetical protein